MLEFRATSARSSECEARAPDELSRRSQVRILPGALPRCRNTTERCERPGPDTVTTGEPLHMTDDHTDTLRVYLIVNGPLGMSPGKIAAQSFQACERLHRCIVRIEGEDGQSFEIRQAIRKWKAHTTTIAKVATTPKMFKRVCADIPGVIMIDEGYTEVPAGSPTVFASWPMRQVDAPALLNNKKIPLL